MCLSSDCELFLLMLPLLAGIFTILSLWYRKDQLKKRVAQFSALWAFLLILNVFTLTFIPVIYTKTNITMFVYHMLLVPSAGAIPVIVTGFSGIYYWLVAHYSNRQWLTVLLAFVGFFWCVVAFYFFMRGPYFAQFIISLNSNKLNY